MRARQNTTRNGKHGRESEAEHDVEQETQPSERGRTRRGTGNTAVRARQNTTWNGKHSRQSETKHDVERETRPSERGRT